MKRLSRQQMKILAAVGLVVTTVAACGPSGKKSSGSNPPPAPQKPDMDSVYFLDANTITGNSGTALTWKEKPVVWSYSLTIDGQPVDKKTNVSAEDLRTGLASHAVKGSSSLSLEIALRGTEADGSLQILATNVEEDAQSSPAAAAIWSEACGSVSPEVDILGDATVVEQGGKKMLQLDLKLCDFARILVAPTIGVKPIQYKEDPRLVVYECTSNNNSDFHSSNKVLYAGSPYESTCIVGYTAPASDAIVTRKPMLARNGSEKAIEIPANKTIEPFTIRIGNDFLNYVPNAPASKRFRFEEDDLMAESSRKLPLSRIRDCHSLEMQVMYKDSTTAANGTAKESRVTFTQTFDAADQVMRWVADDQSALPSHQAMYAAAQTKFKYWLHCTWQNKLGADVARVSTGN